LQLGLEEGDKGKEKKTKKKTDHMSSRKKLLYFCDFICFYLGSF